jgi:hypothetical protein
MTLALIWKSSPDEDARVLEAIDSNIDPDLLLWWLVVAAPA